MSTTSSKKKNSLFSKIESRADALKVIKESAIAFVAIGLLQVAAAIFLFPELFFDAVVNIVLGLVLMFLKSRIAAVLLLLWSGAAVVITVLNMFGITASGGTNVIMSLIIFWAAVKAVEATFKLYGRFAHKSGGFGQEEYVIPEELTRPRPPGFSLDELMQSEERNHAKPRFSTLEWVLIGLAGMLVLVLLVVVLVVVLG